VRVLRTEYVYVLERDGTGVGTSVYLTNEQGAEENAKSSAEESLRDYLANDFDPVPCPVCGHYQRYMFPKLIETKSPWGLIVTLVVLTAGALSAVSAMYWGINYLQRPTDRALSRLGVSIAILTVTGVVGAGLSALRRARERRFDPNSEEDQQARIEKGRSRAFTRSEFEASQRQAASPSPPAGMEPSSAGIRPSP
jgi:hypothetical protein